MELQEFELEKKEYDIPLDDFPERPGKRRKGRRGGKWRFLILIPAAALVAAVVLILVNWTTLSIRFSPNTAVLKGAAAWKRLPDPGNYGILGTVSWKGSDADCSGTLRTEVTEDGLALWAEGVSLRGKDVNMDFSCFLSPHEAVLCSPGLTGGLSTYLGVSLDESILEQTQGTGGDPDYGWYYDHQAIAAFQRAADEVKEALSGVTTFGLTEEQGEAAARLVRAVKLEVAHEDGWYFLTGTAAASDWGDFVEAMGLEMLVPVQDMTLTFTLNPDGVLTAMGAESSGVELYLDLGSDPTSYLAPRVEFSAWDSSAARWGATLAITVEKGKPLSVPTYRNAFTLLPRVDDPVVE